MKGLITLTTDFGTRDPYIGQLKGVIWNSFPEADIVDLTHEIPPHDILEGAYFIFCILPYFPPDTTHIIIVDPGVGTIREPLAIKCLKQFIVCPNNGLLTLLVQKYPLEECYIIENPSYFRSSVSTTFHGRDIFAPVAAAIAKLKKIPRDVGKQSDAIMLLNINPVQQSSTDCISSTVIHVDRFGNLITNLHKTDLKERIPKYITCANKTIHGISPTYGYVEQGELLALFNSMDLLEIAVREGNAAQILNAKRGTIVSVYF